LYGRKGIWPVKKLSGGCWRGYLSGARCRLAYGPADATATHYLLLQQIPDGFTFLVLAHPGSPGQRAIKQVYVNKDVYTMVDVCTRLSVDRETVWMASVRRLSRHLMLSSHTRSNGLCGSLFIDGK